MSLKRAISTPARASHKSNCSLDFRAAGGGESRENRSRKGNTTHPFSIRLTPGERVWLEDRAGDEHLGAYIRGRLLADQTVKRRASRKPKVDDKNLAIILALLGDQRIASNLNQLARHANMGTLEISDAVSRQIEEACAAMIAVRNYLLDTRPEPGGGT